MNRHAGLHFPNGDGRYSDILRLPTDLFLVLETEARWHLSTWRVQRPDATFVWRAMANQGKRPSEVGWSRADTSMRL